MRPLIAAALLILPLALAGGAGAQSPTLFGTVGPGFSIRLADASGNPVPVLSPGTYTIQIEDKSDAHNFHLTGTGVNTATDVEQVGTVIWTVTFVAGTYHYQCDPHATTMRGDITVGTPPAPSPSPPAPSPPVKPAKKPIALAAAVGPGARITLGRLGVRVRTLTAGPVVILVRDRSAKDNFHLVGPGVNRATPRAGKPTVTWRLTLRRGTYSFRSDATPALRGSFRVTL